MPPYRRGWRDPTPRTGPHGWAGILRAGPLCQAGYGLVVTGLALAAPLDMTPTCLVVVAARAQVWAAAANLSPNGAPESDGAQIAAIRARLRYGNPSDWRTR